MSGDLTALSAFAWVSGIYDYLEHDMIIKEIAEIQLNMRYKPELAACVQRSGLRASLGRVALYRVELDNGVVGYGDGTGVPDDVSAFVGRDAFIGLKQIAHGGVQMALYDAVGKALGVPAHQLMGKQVRDRVPFAYWSCCLSPEEWARQVEQAAALGYRVYKFKCRPWWDPIEQIEAVAKVAPPGFTCWLDFNGHLREVRQALPVRRELDRYDCVGGFESPMPQRDGEGYRQLRAKLDKPIAAHYGGGCCHVRSDPTFDRGVSAVDQIARGLCDGFVLGGGHVQGVLDRAAVAQEAKLPFWIQVVGTGLRAAWVVHLASVCRQATLSSLAAHNIWDRDFALSPSPVAGFAAVPEGPGLGVEVDEAMVAELGQAEPLEIGREITTVVHPDGVKWHFASEQQRHETFYFGSAPGFVRGVRLETRADDGSADFDDLFRRCKEAPVLEGK